MKNLSYFFIASTLMLNATIGFAENPNSRPGDMLKALESLKSNGYLIVKEIEYTNDKGAFEADVINADGKKIEVTVNPQSGVVTKPADEKESLAAVDIAKKVQDAGYPNIYKISTELFGNYYKVKALDDKNEEVELKLDVTTGNIAKAEKD